MKSLGQMITQLDAMIGTFDLTNWEDRFITDVSGRTNCGEDTRRLSEKQIDVIQRLYQKHFGDA